MPPLCLDPVETPRLLLRPLTAQDLDALAAIVCDNETMLYVGDGKPRSIAETKAYLAWVAAHYGRHGLGPLGVMERATGLLIGRCGFLVWEGELPEIEIACLIDRERRRQGFAAEACAALVARAAGHPAWPTSYLIASVHFDDRAGKALALKLGMQLWEVRDVHGRPRRIYRLDLKGRS